MKQKPSIYIESTIPSYLTARDSQDLMKLSRQIATRNWWSDHLHQYSPIISQFVLQEIRKGDKSAAAKREDLLKGILVLETTDEVEILAKMLIERLRIPVRAKLDGYHLAIAVIYKIDFLVSWNFEHIVGPPVRKTFSEIGRELGIQMPTLCTPFDFLGGE